MSHSFAIFKHVAEMSIFSILFHFLSVLLGECLQKLDRNIIQWQPFLHKIHNYHLSREGDHIFLLFFSFFIKVLENTERRRKKASEQLRTCVKTVKARGEKRVYIEFPRDSDHANHFLGQVCLFVKGQNKCGVSPDRYILLKNIKKKKNQNES